MLEHAFASFRWSESELECAHLEKHWRQHLRSTSFVRVGFVRSARRGKLLTQFCTSERHNQSKDEVKTKRKIRGGAERAGG